MVDGAVQPPWSESNDYLYKVPVYDIQQYAVDDPILDYWPDCALLRVFQATVQFFKKKINTVRGRENDVTRLNHCTPVQWPLL